MMKDLAKSFILRWLFKTIYFLGLTFLLPFLLTKNIPTQIGMLRAGPPLLFTLAILFIFVGFLGIFYTRKEVPKTLSNIGWITIFPGLLGVVVSILGKDFVIKIIEHYLNIELIRTIIIGTLDKASSQVWILTASYLVIGVGLIVWSRKIR